MTTPPPTPPDQRFITDHVDRSDIDYYGSNIISRSLEPPEFEYASNGPIPPLYTLPGARRWVSTLAAWLKATSVPCTLTPENHCDYCTYPSGLPRHQSLHHNDQMRLLREARAAMTASMRLLTPPPRYARHHRHTTGTRRPRASIPGPRSRRTDPTAPHLADRPTIDPSYADGVNFYRKLQRVTQILLTPNNWDPHLIPPEIIGKLQMLSSHDDH